METLTLTAEDVIDLLAGRTINLETSAGGELIVSADPLAGVPGSGAEEALEGSVEALEGTLEPYVGEEDLAHVVGLVAAEVHAQVAGVREALVTATVTRLRTQAEVVGAAKVLRRFAAYDLHGLVPHSEIANQWYHRGLEAAQREAVAWAEEREDPDTAAGYAETGSTAHTAFDSAPRSPVRPVRWLGLRGPFGRRGLQRG